jgi:pimeloyl-ACP methyl ester carboxylesterase/DNA-binding CsgD family transcriptional regulator
MRRDYCAALSDQCPGSATIARARMGRTSRSSAARVKGELMSTRTRHTVRYVAASDDVRLAWAESGAGITLVKAATWLTHLEYDLDSPVWRHWTAFLSGHFRFVRYDERGCGMSDWDVRDLSLERRVRDLETIVEAAQKADPFVMLGISHGAAVCIAYAVRHPEHVLRMVLCGGFARGALRRGDDEARRMHRAIIDLAGLWGSDNPAFRQVFTSRFIPEGNDEQLRWFNDLCRKTTSPELAGALLRARADTDVTGLLKDVRTPTLVVHARDDAIAPLSEGRLLASEIPGAQFVELDSRNHVLLEHEPAWARFQDVVLEFTGQRVSPGPDPAFEALSRRERETLALLADGLSNAEIAERLGISEKTVRNHLSHLFDKLGVWSRAQAIVFARERGFVS